MSNKMRLKDILDKTPVNINSAEVKTRLNHLLKNQQCFSELHTTLANRPQTFTMFAFRTTEVDSDDSLRPVIQGISGKKSSGGVVTSDLWSHKQTQKYLKQTQLIKSKSVIKRFAHWEWDQEAHLDRIEEEHNQKRSKIYTQVNEQQSIKQLQSKSGTIKFRGLKGTNSVYQNRVNTDSTAMHSALNSPKSCCTIKMPQVKTRLQINKDTIKDVLQSLLVLRSDTKEDRKDYQRLKHYIKRNQ